MWAGLFTFLAAALRLVFAIREDRKADAANPDLQHEKRTQESDRAVVDGDADTLNRITDDHLRWLQNHRAPDPSGPDDSAGRD